MGRYRSRSRSRSRSPRYSPRPRYSRSPPRRKYYGEPRDRYRDGGGGSGGGRGFRDHRSAPCGLLVRNIALDARPEDLRIPFERFGTVKDVYLPKNYYTGEPRGFGFVKFRNPDDAAEAKYHMNHKVIGGREITIVFAEENRKTPQDMRMTSRISERYSIGAEDLHQDLQEADIDPIRVPLLCPDMTQGKGSGMHVMSIILPRDQSHPFLEATGLAELPAPMCVDTAHPAVSDNVLSWHHAMVLLLDFSNF